MSEGDQTWRNQLLRFLLYMIVGFGAAFLYRYLKS